jgi:hypothetical protein
MKRGPEMKRIAFPAIVAVVGVFASAAVASPGAARHGVRPAVVTSEWTSTYDASSYYGGVTCTGKTVVSKKYPGGRDIETCETTEGTLKNMVAGKGQHEFKVEGGGGVNEWESDSGDGLKTTDYSYKVNKKLTKFKLVAVY